MDETRVIIVPSCGECPYQNTTSNQAAFCWNGMFTLFNFDLTAIHPNCPLSVIEMDDEPEDEERLDCEDCPGFKHCDD